MLKFMFQLICVFAFSMSVQASVVTTSPDYDVHAEKVTTYDIAVATPKVPERQPVTDGDHVLAMTDGFDKETDTYRPKNDGFEGFSKVSDNGFRGGGKAEVGWQKVTSA